MEFTYGMIYHKCFFEKKVCTDKSEQLMLKKVREDGRIDLRFRKMVLME
jgi:hypothetical protein